MDIIQKKICLEQFISRFNSKHPYINESGGTITGTVNWGHIHTDIVISSGLFIGILPIVSLVLALTAT